MLLFDILYSIVSVGGGGGGSTLKKVKKVKLINVKFQNSGLESLTFLT